MMQRNVLWSFAITHTALKKVLHFKYISLLPLRLLLGEQPVCDPLLSGCKCCSVSKKNVICPYVKYFRKIIHEAE